jgi:hypothetical protein
MERIIKTLVILSLGLFVPAYAAIQQPVQNVQQPVQVQKSELINCVKTYPIAYDKLFYLTLAGLNEYNYKIKEIQTKSGYIVFETGYRKFLVSIVYVSSQKSIIKITPYSGNYDFNPTVPQNVFKYIDSEMNNKS